MIFVLKTVYWEASVLMGGGVVVSTPSKQKDPGFRFRLCGFQRHSWF